LAKENAMRDERGARALARRRVEFFATQQNHGVNDMAAKKKKKAKKASKRAAAKKTPAKKSKAKKAAKRLAKKAKKTVKAAAKKAPAKKAIAAKKSAPAKKKQTVGEGDYAASKSFDKDQSSFVAKNKANIPAMGHAAEKALEGPEGDALREAEASAAGRSRDTF
jgi:hypothetical protein